MSLHRFAGRRVRAWPRRGSSWPILVETEAGLFVTKLRGAGQGAPALVAEIVVAGLAEQLGLAVPERALIELPADVTRDNHNDELAALLDASVGVNLGFRFLDGARDPGPSDLKRLNDEFAARVLWLDGLTMNPDRTQQNPNVLFWKGQPWLIDHGAALTFQYRWASLTEDAPREPADYEGHVFTDRTALLRTWDTKLAASLERETLTAVIADVPDSFLLAANPRQAPDRTRALYRAFLWKRLKPPRPFLDLC
jgi:hypothetical protein